MTSTNPATVFVVGCPRSGTTLIGELLAANDNVYNSKESFFLYLMHSWRAMLKPPVAPLTEIFIARAQELMRTVIGDATVDAGKSHFVDHTPWHGLCLNDVWQLFPRAQIIHVVRHPASVVLSLGHSYAAGYSWAGSSLDERTRLWRRFAQALGQYEDGPQFRHFRYEDLCANPIGESRSLFDWVSLQFEDEYLATFATPHAANPGRPFTLSGDAHLGHSNVSRPPPSDEQLLTVVRRVASKEAARFGYEIDAGSG